MDSNALSASLAYLNTLKRATQSVDDAMPGGSAPAQLPGQSFQDLLQAAAENVVDSSQKAESMSLQATAKQAELVDVITAVSNAEMALESVVAVRDRVVQAYQDIIRMPI